MSFKGAVWNILVSEENAALVFRLLRSFRQLGSIAKINRGLISGARAEFFAKAKLSAAYVPVLTGSDVQRYWVNAPSEFVLFERPKSAGGCWDPEVHFADHKLLVRQIGVRPTAAILLEPIAVTGNIFTAMGDSIEDELCLLGALNSSLVRFFWTVMFTDFKSSFPQVTVFSLSQVPIWLPDSAERTVELRKRLTLLVSTVLSLQGELRSARLQQERDLLARRISAQDEAIDSVVYQLYGLTDEEIRVVEASFGSV